MFGGLYLLPVQLIAFPLHSPDAKQVLVAFPVKLEYPLWQEKEQFDPKVVAQGMVDSRALGGITNEGHLITATKRKERRKG